MMPGLRRLQPGSHRLCHDAVATVKITLVVDLFVINE
jgi:hypothetical protein